jgi:CBS-domain-containing membrane protein
MRTPVVTVSEHEPVQRAAELMAKNGFHSLPVVNADDRLIGIVTTTDMMNGCLRSSGTAVVTANDTEHFSAVDARIAATLERAREAANTSADSQGFAATLLAMQGRLSALEQVTHAAKRFLNAGQDERLHAMLRKAIERADRLAQVSGRPALLGVDAGE